MNLATGARKSTVSPRRYLAVTTILTRPTATRPSVLWTSECGSRTYETFVPAGFTAAEWAEKEEELRSRCGTNDEYLEERRVFLATGLAS
jgi:hypothetical protein